MAKNPPANAEVSGDVGSLPKWEMKWRRKWQPTAAFLPGKSMDRGTWWALGHGFTGELNMTEHAHM